MKEQRRLAYQGEEPYAFISYAHRDSKDVYPAITTMMDCGYHVWYDEGIKVGEDWAQTIGNKLENAHLMVLFLSKSYVKSENCLREIVFALEHNIPILTVCIGKVKLPENLQRDLKVFQMVNLAKMKTYNAFVQEIDNAFVKAGLVSTKEVLEERKVKIERRKRITLVLITVLVACIAVILCNKYMFGYVPNVIGLETEEAQERVENQKYRCSVSVDYSEDMEYGFICNQNLSGKTLCFRTIQLTQSLGPNSNLAEVPQTEGFHISDGVSLMIDSGFKKLIIEPKRTKECAVTYIAHQSIPAGLLVSTENKILLQVATDGTDIQFTYNGKTVTVPADKKSRISIDENGNLVVEKINTYTLDVKDESEYWINKQKTLFLNMNTVSLTKLEEVDQTGLYRGTVHATFEIFSKKENNAAWETLARALGNKNGRIPTELTIDPILMKMEPFDNAKYEAFVNACDRTGSGIKAYEEPVCMYLAHSITLTQESQATDMLKVLTQFADLFSDRLPVISGDQLYIDYSVVILSDGTADLVFYGDSIWGMEGEAKEQ